MSRKAITKVLLFLFLELGSSSIIRQVVDPDPPNPEETGPFYQGDIMLPRMSLSGRVDQRYRWHNKTIHYEFDEKYPSNLRSTFLQSVQHIATQTCIKFQRVNASSSPQVDYLFVTASASTSCYSYVGRQGGQQIISLPLSCNRLGTMVHELLHAVGFHHEQSRIDRDEYVKIIWENVMPGKENQFRKYDAATVSSFGVEYDYGSVMHYSRFSFSRDASKLETIVPVGNLPEQVKGEIGQRKGMSKRDTEKVNRMYNC